MPRKSRPKILLYFNCKKCVDELPIGETPESFGRLTVGWTKKGLQVFCVRHRLNVITLDFKGQKVDIE